MAKLIITYLLLISCPVSFAETVELLKPPSAWQIKPAVGKEDYLNISGRYQIWGEGAPQTPSRFRGLPYSLDIMLGADLDMSPREKKKITHVSIKQKKGTEITLIFFVGAIALAQRTINQAGRNITCSRDRITISRKSVEIKGEAVRGVADKTDVLFLGQDGSLILYTAIEGVKQSFFIYSQKFKEEYWVRFKPIR